MGLPQWLEHNRQEQAVSQLPPLPADTLTDQPQESAGAEWLVDHLVGTSPAIPVWQGVTFLAERLALLSGGIALGLFAIGGIAGGLPLWSYSVVGVLLLGCQALFLGVRYAALPCHSSWRVARSELSEARTRVSQIERAMKALKNEILPLDKPLAELRARYQQIPRRYQEAVRESIKRHNAAIAENDILGRGLEDDEAGMITGLHRRLQRDISPLVQQENLLDTEQQQDLSESLRQDRDQYIRSYLYDRSIGEARLPGVGVKLKGRLHAAGIRSAADVSNVRRVHGIGDAKASLIEGWAAKVRQQAEASAPTSLPPPVHQQIADKYESRRRSLESQIERLQRQNTSEKLAVMDEFAGRRHQLQATRLRLEGKHAKQKQVLAVQLENEKRSLSEQYKVLHQQIAGARKTKEKKQQELSRGLFQAKINLSMKEREVMRYANLSFVVFVRKVVCV
jgi:hypothetical protein